MMTTANRTSVLLATGLLVTANAWGQTVLTNSDGTIRNSLCVGFDCATESFGSDTIRLKENNLRIHFDDTSSSGSFPNQDWRIIINDDTNGGTEHFTIQDSTGNRNIFRLEAGAPNNALVVESSGDIGFGTLEPVTELHTVDGDTPALRLHQDGSSGFATQVWDVAGNETSFFIRDVTNGSQLPFRIRPGANSDSLVIDSDNNVGVGVLDPDSPIHVLRADDTINFMTLQSTNVGLPQDRAMMYLENNGGIRFEFRDTNQAAGWRFQAQTATHDRFEITKVGTGEIEFDLRQTGNLFLAGNVFTNSDVNAKRDIEPVDTVTLLDRLDRLPVSEWTYKDDAENSRHLGPMAQDFHAAFGLGPTATAIAPMDLAGVSLAAVKAMREQQQDLQSELDAKDRRIGELEARLKALEALILGKDLTAASADGR